MKIFALSVLAASLTVPCQAQTKGPVVYNEPCIPTFPGGNAALIAFVQTNIHYPDSAKKYDIQGKVTVGFKIDTLGKIDSIRVFRGINPYLDQEALRVVHLLPSFIPCKAENGRFPYYYTLPILFQL